jgi:acetyl esterase/lipase
MRSLLSVLLSLLLGGCSATGFLNSIADQSALDVSRDIPYGDDARRTLDIYAPRDARAAPLAVFFYGGGWESGAKESYAFVAAALANEGIITVVPDYRVYPAVRFPDFLNDAAQATRWAKDHAADYGGDPDRIFLVGHSAGAHIAAMLTLDRQWLNTVGLDPRRDVAGTVGLAGPYDFLPLHSATLKTIFGAPDDLARTQPITFVDGGAPPMLLITGTNDWTVDPENTTRLAERIQSKGGTAKVITYPWIGHIVILGAIGRPLRLFTPTLRDTVAFIKNQHRD